MVQLRPSCQPDHYKSSNLNPLFFQVLYLDSLDIPGLATPHNNFPRIREFSYEKLRSMILADKNYAKHKSSDDDLPPGKVCTTPVISISLLA
jgi:hypothetical protein